MIYDKNNHLQKEAKMENFKVISEKIENIEQLENEDTCTLILENGNVWQVQRVDELFKQELGCQLCKNGESNPDWDDESDFVSEYANQM
jgi:hypothetical protein